MTLKIYFDNRKRKLRVVELEFRVLVSEVGKKCTNSDSVSHPLNSQSSKWKKKVKNSQDLSTLWANFRDLAIFVNELDIWVTKLNIFSQISAHVDTTVYELPITF